MKFKVLILFLSISYFGYSQVIQFNNEEAIIKYEHLSEKVEGTVNGIKVDLKLNLKDITKSQIVGRADATTLKTGIKLRDNHLQSKNYFFTEEFPFMTFASSDFKKTSSSTYEVSGRIRIKGIEKQVTWYFKEDTFAWVGKCSVYTNDFEIHQKKDRDKSKVDITIVLPLK